MPMHDFECSNGHVFEKMVDWTVNQIKCEKCTKKAFRVFLSRKERRVMETPMVIFKYADGSYGPPGRSDAPTPSDAERIEIRSMAEYDSVMKDWNRHEKSKRQKGFEHWQEQQEKMTKMRREELSAELAKTSDPLAKDLLRAALERNHEERFTYNPIFNEAMEYNRSNREEWWSEGETGFRGRR